MIKWYSFTQKNNSELQASPATKDYTLPDTGKRTPPQVNK